MRAPDCKIPHYSIHFFTWNGNKGAVEASDLRLPAGKQPGERVWSDACDVGFMVCGRTRNVLFTQVGEDRDPEGEFRSWRFASENNEFEITIFND